MTQRSLREWRVLGASLAALEDKPVEGPWSSVRNYLAGWFSEDLGDPLVTRDQETAVSALVLGYTRGA